MDRSMPAWRKKRVKGRGSRVCFTRVALCHSPSVTLDVFLGRGYSLKTGFICTSQAALPTFRHDGKCDGVAHSCHIDRGDRLCDLIAAARFPIRPLYYRRHSGGSSGSAESRRPQPQVAPVRLN
ncbi:hypothetical protein J6590_005751 [Homalodisca vitripennis]|nr:hypothetical protein J6590_005751 [Homalodisca vitripennis]